MIDDTLLSVVESLDVPKLIAFENATFKNFMTNIKTKESKLAKDKYYLPSKEQRERQALNWQNEKLKEEAANKERDRLLQ
jgi:hypothetical protein